MTETTSAAADATDNSATETDTRPEFELGLVMAGAISAGAYTAGVLDFLCEALAQVEVARGGTPATVPAGRVKLRVVSGASAGGMCGAMLLGALTNQAEPVRQDPGDRCANPLFDAWVNRVDIDHLLETGDLALSAPDTLPGSLLDCAVLDDIARDALRLPTSMPDPPDWLAEHLDLLLTVTNLRGVPYEIGFQGSDFKHGMLLHADYLHFNLYRGDPATGALIAPYRSAWKDLPSAPWLGLLREGALATGAFPLALRPRMLQHDFAINMTGDHGQDDTSDLYSRRRWSRYRFWRDATAQDKTTARPPLFGEATTVFGREQRTMQCHWPGHVTPRPYRFVCVDGGLMNNEPLELARRVLTQNNGSLDASGKHADRALIMIDPFPGGELAAADYQPPGNLLAGCLAMFGALKNQARFKPQELLDAMDDGVFSRFLIAPSREWEGGKYVRGEQAIACGSLGGFGGFLERGFRVHDYFLGRANCQTFLREHFVLPNDNPLFGDDYRQTCATKQWGVEKKGKPCLPIIPLLGTAAEKVPVPAFPKLPTWRLDQIMGKVGRRFDAVTDRFIDVLTHNERAARVLSRLVRNLKRRQALQSIRSWLKSNLERHGLW